MTGTCRFDFAPLEGITDYTYRTAHSRFFPGVDRYYTPFIAVNETCSMKKREQKDVAPEHNSGVVLVPQILTNSAGPFVWAAKEMAARGWHTVNLNLGCPSPTVFTHGKGAGFLADPERLNAFFDEVFTQLPGGIGVSVKTRIGIRDTKEAAALIAVFRRYPISELIVHPRLREEFYKGEVHREVYRMFSEEYPGALTYNGDIGNAGDFAEIRTAFPGTERVMIGRGLIGNPALVRVLKGGKKADKKELRAFHDAVFEARLVALDGFGNTAGKMKEIWSYMGSLFISPEKQLKRIRKARTELTYRAAVSELFGSCQLR